MHVRDWDPQIKSFLVRSKQPGLGCHQLGAKQPLQQRSAEGNPIASNYFFRSVPGLGSADSARGMAFTAVPPCTHRYRGVECDAVAKVSARPSA